MKTGDQIHVKSVIFLMTRGLVIIKNNFAIN